jgi:hypothetical protein
MLTGFSWACSPAAQGDNAELFWWWARSCGTKTGLNSSPNERFCAARTREMFVSTAPNDQARERLLAVVDKIDADVAAVALWACALSGFAQPVRDYEPADLDAEYIRAALAVNVEGPQV